MLKIWQNLKNINQSQNSNRRVTLLTWSGLSKYCQNFMLIWKYEDIKYARFHEIKSPCSLFLHLLHHIRCKQFPLPWMDNGATNSSNLIFWNSQIGWICKIVLIMQICWCWFFKFREPAKYYFADFFVFWCLFCGGTRVIKCFLHFWDVV